MILPLLSAVILFSIPLTLVCRSTTNHISDHYQCAMSTPTSSVGPATTNAGTSTMTTTATMSIADKDKIKKLIREIIRKELKAAPTSSATVPSSVPAAATPTGAPPTSSRAPPSTSDILGQTHTHTTTPIANHPIIRQQHSFSMPMRKKKQHLPTRTHTHTYCAPGPTTATDQAQKVTFIAVMHSYTIDYLDYVPGIGNGIT